MVFDLSDDLYSRGDFSMVCGTQFDVSASVDWFDRGDFTKMSETLVEDTSPIDPIPSMSPSIGEIFIKMSEMLLDDASPIALTRSDNSYF